MVLYNKATSPFNRYEIQNKRADNIQGQTSLLPVFCPSYFSVANYDIWYVSLSFSSFTVSQMLEFGGTAKSPILSPPKLSPNK